MKKFKVIFTAFVYLFIVNACNDDDLELTNPTQLSPESFFKTKAQVESAVNSVYVNLQTRGLYSRHMFFSQDNMAQENGGNSQLEADKRQYLDFSFDASHGPIGAYWESCYKGISKTNFVIDNEEAINAIAESEIPSAIKNKYIGEAKYMRAFYYFLLVTRFGDIPLITSTPQNTEGAPISPRADVYAQIIQDLKDASSVLLDKGAEQQGRATKGAAIALLGKTYLFQKEYQLALDEFDKLSGYSLETDYFDNFKEETEFGVESIWEINYDASQGSSNEWDSDVTGQGVNEATFRAQEYGVLNWFNVYPSDDLLNEYETGDTRFADNFYVVGDTYNNGENTMIASDFNDAQGSARNAGWKKYQNYYKQDSETPQSGINMKVIRYSDVLLMMAECSNEVETQATAVGYINQVRTRASLAGLPTTLSKAQVFDAIVHERKVELAGEQVRFNDIVRWQLWSELSGTSFNPQKHNLWPIPLREIDSNPKVQSTDQNPGY